MSSNSRSLSITILAPLLAAVCHAATVSNADDDRPTSHAITVEAKGDDTASIPDFDGDGTVGFSDFVQFAAQFGLSQGDEEYDARFDLDGNGAIGFVDLLIFPGAFGKDISSS